jgi:hypothetical protein
LRGAGDGAGAKGCLAASKQQHAWRHLRPSKISCTQNAYEAKVVVFGPRNGLILWRLRGLILWRLRGLILWVENFTFGGWKTLYFCGRLRYT